MFRVLGFRVQRIVSLTLCVVGLERCDAASVPIVFVQVRELHAQPAAPPKPETLKP